MKLLAADTSSRSLGLAVLEGEELRAEITIHRRGTHSRTLMRLVETALGLAGLELAELDGLAAVAGPGSFTGLRIGLSTLKGLALGLGKPVVGISSLEALAHQLPETADPIWVLVDARKGQVYRGAYRWTPSGPEELVEPAVLAPEAVAQEIRRPALLAGDGALLYRDLLEQETRGGARLAPAGVHTLRASTVARMAHARLVAGTTGEPALLTPLYLRPSDAELARAAGQVFIDTRFGHRLYRPNDLR
ncbi:MAG: tRNA (adenosine(37)-N6)-threonylcarbamoyltransferase complex dimerization subunit type 1 TsaB [Desulfococcaceae bacterium]